MFEVYLELVWSKLGEGLVEVWSKFKVSLG